MNKGLIIGIAAIIILSLVGLGGYMALSNKTSQTNENQTISTDQNTQTQSSDALQTLKDLFTTGASQQCQFTDPNGNTGTLYINNGQMRGDIVTTSNNTTINTHMIVKEKVSYIWMDDQKTGFKVSFDINQTPAPQASAKTDNEPQSIDPNQKLDYNCSAWSTDSSKFTLPTGVTFSDFSSMMMQPNSSASGSTMPKVDCSTCNALSGDAKNACLTALKCM